MTERRRGARRHARRDPHGWALYRSVLEEVDPRVLSAAEQAEGLSDELTVVRLLLRRQLQADPQDLELVLKGLHLLVRMVIAQHKLSGEDAQAFSGQADELARHFAAAIFSREETDG